MPYKEVWIDDEDLDNFDDQELIDELQDRGYLVIDKKEKEPPQEIEDAVWHFRNGRKKDALIMLERIYPELYGLSKLI